MQERRESWFVQLTQYVLFSMAAAGIVVFYARFIHVNQTTVALSFLVLILFTAFQRPLAYSIYLSLLCTVLYNYYFLPPVHSLTIADPQNLIALLAFLTAGISVNHISAKERKQAASLARQSEELGKLYAFSRRLLLEDKLQQLSMTAPALLAESFQLRAVALYLPTRKDAIMWDPEHLMEGMENLHDATQATGVASRSGAGIRIVPLMLGMRTLGALAIAESGYSEGLYDAIGSLTAVAIERASALERNSRSEAAREGELLRTALLDSITHELRTPLTGIRLAATTLSNGGSLDEASRADLLSVIEEESRRMDGLIDEAVTMAQLSTGDVHLRREPADFASVLEAAVNAARSSMRARELRVNVSGTLGPIVMDADLIRRVVQHLLENAAQYSPPKSAISISAAAVRGRLEVKVENEGPGISEEDQPYVFERFFRGSNAGVHPDGTGMGLAVVKAIVEAHQGRIAVRSSPGNGATFAFWIPATGGDTSQALLAK